MASRYKIAQQETMFISKDTCVLDRAPWQSCLEKRKLHAGTLSCGCGALAFEEDGMIRQIWRLDCVRRLLRHHKEIIRRITRHLLYRAYGTAEKPMHFGTFTFYFEIDKETPLVRIVHKIRVEKEESIEGYDVVFNSLSWGMIFFNQRSIMSLLNNCVEPGFPPFGVEEETRYVPDGLSERKRRAYMRRWRL